MGDAEEYIDGEFAGKLGEILIRCNNVMYIRGAEEQGGASENMDD
jgi:small nuclear ribonucleoprotein F